MFSLSFRCWCEHDLSTLVHLKVKNCYNHRQSIDAMRNKLFETMFHHTSEMTKWAMVLRNKSHHNIFAFQIVSSIHVFYGAKRVKPFDNHKDKDMYKIFMLFIQFLEQCETSLKYLFKISKYSIWTCFFVVDVVPCNVI